jgi:hypothetical protein
VRDGNWRESDKAGRRILGEILDDIFYKLFRVFAKVIFISGKISLEELTNVYMFLC